MFLGCNVAFSSMPVFLPTIINKYVPTRFFKITALMISAWDILP